MADSGQRMDVASVLERLCHRYPAVLVETVSAIEPGRRLSAVKNVSVNEEFFQGHFPLARIMPGVLIVEAMAQAGGILIYHSVPEPQSKFMLFSKIDDMKFRRPVVPGDQLHLEAELTKVKGRFHQLHGRAFADGELAVEGLMWASLMDREELNGVR